MKSSIRERLHQVSSRYEEVGLLLSQPEVFSDQNRFRELSVEYAQLEPLVKSWERWQTTQASIEEAQLMLEESDPEMRQLAEDELQQSTSRLESLENQIQLLLLPRKSCHGVISSAAKMTSSACVRSTKADTVSRT